MRGDESGRARLIQTVALSLALFMVVGCSRGGEPTDDEALQGMGAEQFATAYSAVAERYADSLEEVQTDGAPAVAADPVGAAEVYAALRDVTEAARGEFAALRAPREVADDLDAVVDLFAEQIQALTEAVTASQARDDRSLETHLGRYAELLAEWRHAHGALLAQLDEA